MTTDAMKALQAVMLLSKHLTDILPFLLALEQVPASHIGRIGLVQSTARAIADTHELAKDWYAALELLSGEDLSARSVADLLLLSQEYLKGPALGEIWQACYRVGLLDDEMMGQWVVYDQLA